MSAQISSQSDYSSLSSRRSRVQSFSHSRLKHFEPQNWSRISSDPTDRSTFLQPAAQSALDRNGWTAAKIPEDSRFCESLFLLAMPREFGAGYSPLLFVVFITLILLLESRFSILHKTQGASWVLCNTFRPNFRPIFEYILSQSCRIVLCLFFISNFRCLSSTVFINYLYLLSCLLLNVTLMCLDVQSKVLE